MRFIALKREIFVNEIVNVFLFRIQFQLRKKFLLARDLLFHLLEMIGIYVQVTENMNEFTRRNPDNLRNHEKKQGIARDVEWHSQEYVRAALIHSQIKFVVHDRELIRRMAKWGNFISVFGGGHP